jgi:lipopolysaccharide heptosyltransferase II
MVHRLAAQRHEAAVIFTVCSQSALPAALMCRLAGIQQRLAHSRENPYGLLTHWRPETDPVDASPKPEDHRQGRRELRHEVRRQLDLLASVGATLPASDEGLRFALRPVDRESLRQRLARAGIEDHEPIVVVHPGARAPSRRWPAERFGHAALLVARECHCRIVVAGGRADRAAVQQAAAAIAGREPTRLMDLSLGELAALIARAQVLMCNNSAPAHLAAALGTPVVVAYALTNPQHTPWLARQRVLSHDVPCRDCQRSVCPEGHHQCLRGVHADTMAAAALDLMREAVLA